MTDKYILNEQGNPVVERDLMKWARWFEVADRNIACDTIGDVRVSTAFLGLNHSIGSGPPILFETMIFGGDQDQFQERYPNRHEALAGHDRAVASVRNTTISP